MSQEDGPEAMDLSPSTLTDRGEVMGPDILPNDNIDGNGPGAHMVASPPFGGARHTRDNKSGHHPYSDRESRGRDSRSQRWRRPERHRSASPRPTSRRPGRQSSPQRVSITQATVQAAILTKITLLSLLLEAGKMVKRGSVDVKLIRSKILECFCYSMPNRQKVFRPLRAYHVANNPCDAER